MKSKNILFFILISFVILLVIFMFLIRGTIFDMFSQQRVNNKKLNEAFSNLSEGEYYLKDIVPFEWEFLYSFDPYTNKKQMEEIVLAKSSNKIRETVNEGMVQIIFVNKAEVISTITSYPKNVGYMVVFPERKDFYSFIKSSDNLKVKVDIKNKIRIIKIIK